MKVWTCLILSFALVHSSLAQQPADPMVVTGSLADVMQDLKASSMANAEKERDAQAKGTKPLRKSNTTEVAAGATPYETTFTGTVKFTDGPRMLALLSDDGCTLTITINGAEQKLVERAGQGQAIADYAKSWKVFTVMLAKDTVYTLMLKYSQTFYKSGLTPPDIDGCTLFALLPVETVTINTFIPDNNVEDARPFNGTLFKGDNRHGGSPDRATWNENGSHRTQQKFQVIADQALDANGLVDNAYGPNADGGGNNDRFRGHRRNEVV